MRISGISARQLILPIGVCQPGVLGLCCLCFLPGSLRLRHHPIEIGLQRLRGTEPAQPLRLQPCLQRPLLRLPGGSLAEEVFIDGAGRDAGLGCLHIDANGGQGFGEGRCLVHT